ncbi:MAG: hypothetical protein NTY44_04420, partial [Deltaproteobacteria bacterium]|nr:hypothetical protein [Deltaproteobacteria bacterium]
NRLALLITGHVGSNPTLSAKKFSVAEFHLWLPADSAWQKGIRELPAHVTVRIQGVQSSYGNHEIRSFRLFANSR